MRRRRRAIRADIDETLYRCTACGATEAGWRDRCPECGERASLRPTDLAPLAVAATAEDADAGGRFKTLGQVRAVRMPRILTGVPGMDVVLGDDRERGFAVPSVVLFGGGQGAGKSSISLQAVAGVDPARRVLYLLNEEPEARLLARAERLGYKPEALGHIAVCESDEQADYEEALAEVDPHVVVLDSLSLMKDSRHDVPDEQANRLRYAKWLFREAMQHQRVVLAISHLNKENDIAGVRKIQYVLDAVMTITKIGKGHSVLECPEKNRFGAPGVPSYFSIGRDGLHEVDKADAIRAAMAEARADRGKNPDGSDMVF